MNVLWGYRFDAAVQSPSGRVAVIYERFGTKGLVLDRGNCIREINRSFYHADVYQYPIALFNHPDGRELIAHCPNEYNQIEIEEALTGVNLTFSPARKPDDFFHSRLLVNLAQSRLVSAGWFWHPFDSAVAWVIADVLADPTLLDHIGDPDNSCNAEINSAAFIDDNCLLMSSKPDADEYGRKDNQFKPGSIAIFNLATGEFERVMRMDLNLGNTLWLGHDRLISFYEHPKLIDISTGGIIEHWPELNTGKQDSSIISDGETLPPLALDSSNRRFAVAGEGRITVLQFD